MMCRQNSCKFETPKDASHPRRRNFSRTNSEIQKTTMTNRNAKQSVCIPNTCRSQTQ